MVLFPKFPKGLGAIRSFNLLMVMVVFGCLLVSRHMPAQAENLELVSTIAAILLALGWIVNRKMEANNDRLKRSLQQTDSVDGQTSVSVEEKNNP